MNFVVEVPSGLQIAYQKWGSGSRKILCLHGYADNSNSFSFLGPYLAEHDAEVVAIDLPGHGLSDYHGLGTTYQHCTYVTHVKGIIDKLCWTKVIVVGHSMGGGVATLFAGCYPEIVDRLTLLEGFTPQEKDPKDTRNDMRDAIDTEHKVYYAKTPKAQFATLADAIEARIKVVKLYPGSQSLSDEASAALMARGTALVASGSSIDIGSYVDITDRSAGPVEMRQDPRLLYPTHPYYTVEQSLSFLRSINCPVLLLGAGNGWPVEDQGAFKQKVDLLGGKIKVFTLAGSHHFHLDPKTCGKVAKVALDFINLEF